MRESVIEDPPPHDRGTVTDNSSESTDRSERVPPVILSLPPLFLSFSLFLSVSSLGCGCSLSVSLELSLSFSWRTVPYLVTSSQSRSFDRPGSSKGPFPSVFAQVNRRQRPRENSRSTGADGTVDDVNIVLAPSGRQLNSPFILCTVSGLRGLYCASLDRSPVGNA